MAPVSFHGAPIAVFVYRRPEHTRRMFESLLANPEARNAPIYVFSDGPRRPSEAAAVEETRRVVRALGLAHLTLVERPQNVGLARSIVDGVSRVCAEHGRVIVLEDDLFLAPTFLEYMNEALDRYRDAANVYAVSGFMFPVDLQVEGDAVFLPFFNSHGWGTWDRAWRSFDAAASGHAALRADRRLRRRFDLDGNFNFYEMLEAQAAGRIDSWAIRWYLTIFMREALTLFPAQSLVENRGWGAEASHCREPVPRYARAVAWPIRVRRFPEVAADAQAFERLKRFLGRDFTVLARMTRIGRAVARRLAQATGLRGA